MIKISKVGQSHSAGLAFLLADIVSGSPYFSEAARKGERSKYTEELINLRVPDDKNHYLIAENDSGKIVGYCLGHYHQGTFVGDWLGVVEGERRAGVATALINNLFSYLRDNHVNKMRVHTRLNNKESINLLKKLGFREGNLIKNNWYGEDSRVWEKLL